MQLIKLRRSDPIDKAKEIRPDLILMDIKLADQIDGIEAARQIRLTNDIPVIYLSAYTDKMIPDSVKDTEPYGILSKPFFDYDLKNTIEMALYKHSAERTLKESHERLLMVLDSLTAGVYVADMKTYEILFVNKYTQDIFGDVVGKICWQTLQKDQTRPCSFCTNDKLLTSDGQPADVYCWEFQNTINGRWYYTQDKALKWVDGRTVRMEIATDITERKRAEEEIKRKNIELNTFINSISDMAWFKDTDSNFVIVNKAFGDAVGMEPEYLVNNTCEICFGAEAAKKFKEDDQKVMKSRERVVFEESILDTNGNKVLLETIKAPLFDESGKILGTIGVARDITERKKVEEELAREKKKLENIVDGIGAGLVVLDSETRVIWANDKVQQWFGPIEKLRGKYCSEIYNLNEPDKECAAVAALISGEVETGESFGLTIEDKERCFQLTTAPVKDRDGKIVQFVELVQDTTERKHFEEALQKSEEQGRMLLNSTAEAIYGVDIEGNCTFCNPSFLHLLGYENEEDLIGKNMHSLIHHTRVDGTKYPAEESRIYEVIKGGKGIHVDDEVLWRADGKSIYVEYRCYPIHTDGEIIGAVVTFLDISTRREA
jgi:PAS domain S-box-containing protein